MKIAILSYEYPPETGFGGIGTYSWYQARGLARIGHEVHVLAGATEPTELRRTEHDGVTVFRYRTDEPWRLVRRRLEKHRLQWTRNRIETALSMDRGLHRLLVDNSYDIVEMPECGGEGFFVNGRVGVPTLIKFHSPARLIMDMYGVGRLDRLLCGMVEQRAIRRATALTSCSRFLAGEVRAKLGVRKHVEVIYNGIDLELFDAGEQIDARAEFGIPRDKQMILFSGRLERRKGIHVMKEVAARILARHDVAFVFAGDDLFRYAENEIKPHLSAQALRGSYHFLGRLDLKGVRSCLRQSDVFVIPSLWENCPYSCLEAMAASRAIVASDAGGLPELIHDGENGLIAPVEDVEANVACLERLIEDAALRERLGSAARRKVEESLTDVHIARTSADYYRRVLANGGK